MNVIIVGLQGLEAGPHPIPNQTLLTKDSYIHIDVSNGSLTELGEVLLEKRQNQGYIWFGNSV